MKIKSFIASLFLLTTGYVQAGAPIIPNPTSPYDLGSSSNQFPNVWATNVNATTVNATTVNATNVNVGTVNVGVVTGAATNQFVAAGGAIARAVSAQYSGVASNSVNGPFSGMETQNVNSVNLAGTFSGAHTGNGAGLTNVNSSIFAAGANLTITATTNPVTGVITYTGAASSSGGGNVYSNTATIFTSVMANSFNGNGLGLTNVNSTVVLAGANVTVTTTTNASTGQQTSTVASTGGGGGGNVNSNTATAFTAATIGSITTSNLNTPGSLTIPISYPASTNDMGLYYTLSGQFGSVPTGFFGQIYTTYVTNSLLATNVEIYAGGVSNGVTGWLTLIQTNSLPTGAFTVNPSAPNVIYSAAVNIPLATNRAILNFPIPATVIPPGQFIMAALTTSISNNLECFYYSSSNPPGGVQNINGTRYPVWQASSTNNFSKFSAVSTNALIGAAWSAKVDGIVYGTPTTAAQTTYNSSASLLSALSVQVAIDRLNCPINLSNTLAIVDGDSRSVLAFQYGMTNLLGITSNSAAMFNEMQSMCIGLAGSSAIYASNVWTTNYSIAQNAIKNGTNVIFILLTDINDRFNTDPSNELFTTSNLLASTKFLGCENIVIGVEPAAVPGSGTVISNAGAANFVSQQDNWLKQNRQLVDKYIPAEEMFPNNNDLYWYLDTTHMNTIGWQVLGLELMHQICSPYSFPTRESYWFYYGNDANLSIPGTNGVDWVNGIDIINNSGTNVNFTINGQIWMYPTNQVTIGTVLPQVTGDPVGTFQSGRTNVTLSAATSMTVSMAYPFPSTNYCPSLTANGAAIPGIVISAQTASSFTMSFTAFTFAGNLYWNTTYNTQ